MNYRVVILGGGPAGAACAIHLRQLGIKGVALVNMQRKGDFFVGETIPPEANVLLEQLGVYEDFRAEGHEPCFGSVSYWGSYKRGYNDFIMNPYGHGWHLDRRRFNDFLLEQAGKLGAELWEDTAYKCCRKNSQGKYELTVVNAVGKLTYLQADIVVDATGSRALFAQEQGSKKREEQGLVCLAVRYLFADDASAVSQTTHLEAVRYGWWYGTRLPHKHFLMALFTDAETVKKHQLNQMENWRKKLSGTMQSHLLLKNMVQKDDRPKGFPAPSYCLDRPAGKNWLAIGDAASAYDPITSRGITKSLLDGIRAANRIGEEMDKAACGLEDFGFAVKKQHEEYVHMRRHFYGLEQRWPKSAFWKKMQEPDLVERAVGK